MVFVHGLGMASGMVAPAAPRLAAAAGVVVHAPDLPGFGRSEGPERPLRISELGAALGAWMQARGLGPAALVGNSLGCQVVTELVLQRPELAVRVVLAGPTPNPRARSLDRQLTRWSLEQATHSLALRRLIAGDWARAGLGRVLRTSEQLRLDRIEDRLPFVQVRALVVRGTRDPIVSPWWAEEAARLLPDGRLAVVPGAPHALAHDAPLELVRVLRPFLLAGGSGGSTAGRESGRP